MGNIVYLGDCRQVMKEFPEGSVDLIITSPPYNINLKGAAWDDNMTWAGKFISLKEMGIIGD